MNRIIKTFGAALLLFGMIAAVISQYISGDNKADTAEKASEAVSAVSKAAGRLTSGRTIYNVTVVNRVGQGRVGLDREVAIAVQVTLSVRGSGGLSDVCASLPRVRDAINARIADSITPKLRSRRVLAADELAENSEDVRAAVNEVVEDEAIVKVKLVLRSAIDAQESGCDPNKTASSAPH
jgi:hypothetical protein